MKQEDKETSWKPSKEEMDVLYGLAYITNKFDEHKEEVIVRLYQDLKREFFNGSSYENMFPNTENDVRRRSTIQVLEYARSLDNYNQYGKADIDKNIAWLEKQDKKIQNNMNENIDLTKILDGCPKGTRFYSTIYGEVEFDGIEEAPYEVAFMTKRKTPITFTPSGKYIDSFDGECTIFPSKDQRDWAKFERFWDTKVERFDPKTLKPFDKILIKDEDCCWTAAIFSHMDDNIQGAICCGDFGEQCIPYNEETKHLIGTKEDCPEFYKWWEE